MKLPWAKKDRKQENHDAVSGVLWQNEIHANRLTAAAMCVCAGIAALCMLLRALGVFLENPHLIYSTCGAAIVWHLVPSIVCFCYKGSKPWIKYVLMVCLIIGQARVNLGLGYNVMLCILLPVVFSTRYYSRRLTLGVALITSVIFGLTTYLGAVTGFSPLDKNILGKMEYYPRDVMMLSFFPKWMVFAVISGICTEIASRGREMVYQQASISQEHSRVETELHTASKIQLESLPGVDTVLKDSAPFDLATSMKPAKEVGGDFYDFFYTDPTHLAMVIADVSGKGVPAALFMMVSKTLLNAGVAMNRRPGKVLAAVNHQLCEKNINDMFVTVWLGILDLTTGELVSANAGHEYPIVCRSDGTVEVIKDKHGMVLGGIDGARYRDDVTHLNLGDTLFVYTDGIPEAHNIADEMYGMNRLTAVLKNRQAMPLQVMVDTVQQDVNAFAGEAPQFDDSTMLALRLNALVTRPGMQVRPDLQSIVHVQEYVASQMDRFSVPMNQATKIKIGLDEMYSNIVHYSGASWAEVVCTVDNSRVTVVLRDNGVPYDPTQHSAPNVAQNAEERRVGGLGIYMTRKMLDGFTYQYVNGSNETTMSMNL